MWLVGANFLVPESFVPATGHVDLVTIFLQQDKCYSLFCNFLSLYEWKVLYL